jgi:antitoxin VapB
MINLSRETVAFAERIAAAKGLTLEDAVRQALEAWARAENIATAPLAPRDTSPAAVARRKASIDTIVAEIAGLPILDPRSPREIMDDLDSL